MKRIVLFIAILFSFGLFSYAQEPCAPGQQFCNGQCQAAAACNRKNPPPPGLVVPIDTNIQFLLAAGLCLGICFFGFQKKGGSSFQASENKK